MEIEINRLPCPVCGFQTLADFYGSYDICPVCGWEDDGVQLANPTSGGGANTESLAQAQKTALERYSLGIDAAEEYRRGNNWRPLSEAEIAEFDLLRDGAHWHSRAVSDETEAYWANSPISPGAPDSIKH